MKYLYNLLFLGTLMMSTTLFGQTPNNCLDYTSTGTTSSGYDGGTNAVCNSNVPGVVTGTGAWTGSGCTGFITSTVTGPPVTCLTVSYAYVNYDDYGTISTDTGGALTITGVNVDVVGNVVGPYNCPEPYFYGNVSITVCSTIPFTSLTLTNTGCSSGWVVNCVDQVVTCDPSWTVPSLCSGDPIVDLSTLITGDTGGTWSGSGVTGTNFDPAAGTQMVKYIAPCGDSLEQQIVVGTTGDAAWTPPTNVCESDAVIDLNTLITGMTGGTWSGTGVTGNMFDPSVGTQTITYTSGTTPCEDINAQSITVTPSPDPSWTTLTLCSSDAPVNLTGQITGTTGGTWSGNGLSGSVFDPFFGSQSITYSVTSGSCSDNLTQTISVVDPQLTMSSTPVSCFGLSDGSADVVVTGGSGSATFNWNTSPPQTTATASNIPAGTYTVTVSDGSCVVTDSVTVIEPNEILANISGTNGCTPTLGTASVTASGGAGGFTYAWTNSTQTSATITGLDSAMYAVTVTDANGCTFTDSVLVQIYNLPTITAMPDSSVIYGECINLTALGGVSYEWTPDVFLDCDNCISPEACPLTATNYCVEGTDANGCKNSDCVLIDVEIICGEVFVPSGFSPNDDGENDLLCVYSDCMESMTFSIYNRWGEKVYETSSLDICWDGTWNGKQLNSAVFVYVLDGYLINGELINQKGNISLVR